MKWKKKKNQKRKEKEEKRKEGQEGVRGSNREYFLGRRRAKDGARTFLGFLEKKVAIRPLSFLLRMSSQDVYMDYNICVKKYETNNLCLYKDESDA